MNYEEKYKQALERASKLKVQNPFDTVGQMVEHIFPELKESESEKIRKAIISCCLDHGSKYKYLGVSMEDMCAWLEKQDKAYRITNTPNCGVSVNIYNEELKESEDEKIKFEPKFHEGDWITDGYIYYKITEILDDRYIIESKYDKRGAILFEYENRYHLWTIKDAKDGDALINWNNTTFIFKAIEDETVKYHVAYNEKWDTIKTPSTKLSHLGLPEPQFEFHPATKEQYDLLFSKMKEAGCEWDSKKKELKKIPTNPCLGCNHKSCMTCVDGDHRETDTPKILYSDEVIEWLYKNVHSSRIVKFKKDFEI